MPQQNFGSSGPYRCRYGYDVMVYAGKAMFLRCRNEGEIHLELADKRVRISKREVSVLARKFIVYLSVAHKQSQHRLPELLSSGGGATFCIWMPPARGTALI